MIAIFFFIVDHIIVIMNLTSNSFVRSINNNISVIMLARSSKKKIFQKTKIHPKLELSFSKKPSHCKSALFKSLTLPKRKHSDCLISINKRCLLGKGGIEKKKHRII
ncbi:hypothetical protein BpHYR1_005095 [Brachionus plicatilis]|uniref:Uncharacterized protein n=1 Tax=Brachionus plicatilis TaxID=10195 RepID=A0A3M7QYN0_BRAPC|nr:hypothetical protein BpHYR1_005095 [Brachionus plicatilis]